MIAELQRHDRVALDFDALRGIVEDIAILGTHLFYNDRHARSQAINANGTGAVGHILTIGSTDDTSVRVGHKELDIGDGCAGHGVLFNDEKRPHLIVAESNGDDILILTGKIDRLRGVGDDIPIRSRDLLADVSACLEASYDNSTITRGTVLTDDCPARARSTTEITDTEPCTLQRLACLTIHLANDDGRKGRILKSQDFALTAGNKTFLRGRLLDRVAWRRLQLRHLVPAVLDFGENNLAALIGVMNAEIVQLSGISMVAGIPDLELGSLDGIASHAVHFADLQRRLECVEECNGGSFTGFQRHFLGNGAENDMAGDIDLRHPIGANGNGVKENAPVTVGRTRGGEATIDLLDTVGHTLERLPIGNVLLDDLKPRLFVVNEGDLGGFTGAQRHGLLCIAHNVRLRNGFFPYHVNISGNGRGRRGTICAGSNGRGEVARDRLNGEHRTGNGFATHGIALDDLHVRQRVIFCHNGILLVAIGGIDIDADGRGVCTEALRGLDLHKGPQAFCDILDFNDAAIHRHITTNDLTVAVDIEFRTIQATGGAGGYLFQSNVSVTRRRLIRLIARSVGDEFPRRVVIKERLTALDTRLRIDRPFGSIIFDNGSDDALSSVFFDLLLEFCVFLGLLCQHPIDVAQVSLIGIRIGKASGIDIAVTLTLEGLVIPHICLRGHKEATGDITLIVHDECHHPLEVFKLLGVEFTHAALRQRRLQDSIRIRACRRGIGVAVQETCGSPAIAVATIKAVQQLACGHGRLIAVGSAVMEKPGCPIIRVAGGFNACARTGRSECCGRKQAENCHNQQECRDKSGFD